ncbi:hypothetical protein DFH06DRAFT_1253123 [Mycena polygramma]|nr:hypothetical protein DFH06DRAFT_1253123 [Mycena polygramma]
MSAKRSSSSAKKVVELFETRDIVLAKVRGFPAWPGMVVDPDAVPKAVVKERPATKKSTVYAIRFFPAGDYAWLAAKDLTRLATAQIEEYIMQDAGGRKAGDLMEGYKKALDPVAWEEEHVANPHAAKKRKSKSKAKKKGEDGDEEDELAADDAAEEEPEEEAEEDEEKEKAGKKRKRVSSPAPAKSKAKTPKAAKAKKGGKAKKSKAAGESEDGAAEEAEEEGGEEGEARASKKAKVADGSAGECAARHSRRTAAELESELESDPEALKVREWRHKVQKTFFKRDKSLPKEDEMPAADSLFTAVEGYQNMNIEYLTFSKIGKVMRLIHQLEPGTVPCDEEFKFRDRAKALVDKWQGMINATDGENAAVTESSACMDLNGTGGGEGDLTVMDVTMNADEA